MPEELQLPLTSKNELKSSSLAYHLIVDEEPEEIIELWNNVSANKTLVRFKFIEEDDTGAVGRHK